MLIPIQPITVDPEKIAFQMCESGEQVTFAQLDVRANQVAHLVSELGILPGEHVAVLMNNCRELLELCFGLDRCGVYYTLINTRLTIEEIDYIIRDCDARLFVYSTALKSVDQGLFSKLPNTLKCMQRSCHLVNHAHIEVPNDGGMPSQAAQRRCVNSPMPLQH